VEKKLGYYLPSVTRKPQKRGRCRYSTGGKERVVGLGGVPKENGARIRIRGGVCAASNSSRIEKASTVEKGKPNHDAGGRERVLRLKGQ